MIDPGFAVKAGPLAFAKPKWAGEELPVARCLQQDLALGIQHVGSDGWSGIAEKNILLTLTVFARCIVCFTLTDFAKWG